MLSTVLDVSFFLLSRVGKGPEFSVFFTSWSRRMDGWSRG